MAADKVVKARMAERLVKARMAESQCQGVTPNGGSCMRSVTKAVRAVVVPKD